MRSIRIEPATREDLKPIQNLLKTSDLPWEDVEAFLPDFLVAREGATVVGVAGVEVRGSGGLLRSLAVVPSHRGSGLGTTLYRRIMNHARGRGVQHFGLLTTTAEGFFAKAGFQVSPKEDAPDFVKASREYRELCPASAVFMKLDLP